jgi:hypothetical protein
MANEHARGIVPVPVQVKDHGTLTITPTIRATDL